MAAGRSFLGMTPNRPLKIFYMQTEIEYEYMKERLQQLDNELLDIAANNLIITPKVHLSFNHDEINEIKEIVNERFKPDVLAIDPLRNIFSREYGNENDNSAMLFFLQKTLEKLRSAVNPDACIVLTHHTKIIKKNAGRRSISGFERSWFFEGFYSTGMVMFAHDEESTVRQIVFELRNGERVASKLVDKINGRWKLVDQWS